MPRFRTLVITPTYNEAENIQTLLEGLMEQRSGVHALVVDDASADGTADLVRKKARTYQGRIHLLERPGKLGLGTAYLAGFRSALEKDYDLAVTMDADLSHDPRHLDEMLHMARVADVVIGSRYIAGGGIRNWGPHRHLLSWGANTMARMVVGLRARDCTSGYRCYRRRILESMDFDSVRSDGYSCLMELLAICQRQGARIREIPIVFHDRRAGKSKISSVEMGKALMTLWRLRRWLSANRDCPGHPR